MNKSDLINAINDHKDKPYRVRKGEVGMIVELVIMTIENALAKGEEVNLTGFGKFSVSDRKARTGRNPRTGEALQIPASRGVKFAPGKQLKDAIQQ